MANEAKMVFGSTTTAISLTATLNNATFSGTTTVVDNSTDLYPHVKAVLSIEDTFSAAPSAGGYFGLWMLPQNVDSTNDDKPAPDSSTSKAATLVGVFPVSADDVAYRKTIIIPDCLLGLTGASFYLENRSGVNATYTTNAITVKITPFSYYPGA
jgi:hypothetical protein